MTAKDDARLVKTYRLCRTFGPKGLSSGPPHLHRAAANARRWTGKPMARQLLCGRIDTVLDMEDEFDPRRNLADICPECRAVYEADVRAYAGQPATGRLVF
jgi:hypothetical protein